MNGSWTEKVYETPVWSTYDCHTEATGGDGVCVSGLTALWGASLGIRTRISSLWRYWTTPSRSTSPTGTPAHTHSSHSTDITQAFTFPDSHIISAQIRCVWIQRGPGVARIWPETMLLTGFPLQIIIHHKSCYSGLNHTDCLFRNIHLALKQLRLYLCFVAPITLV